MPRDVYYNRDLRLHPYNITITLMLMGVTMLFVALTGAYLYTRVSTGMAPLKVPLIFVLNTLIILASSYTMLSAKKAYQADKTSKYRNLLLISLLLSLLFIGVQYIGWQQLQAQNAGLSSGPLNAYVTVISFVHAIHIVGGIPFLLLFYITAVRKMKDPITVLLYFTDPIKKLKLDLLNRYWHYLDLLWIYLVAFFYLNYFIQF